MGTLRSWSQDNCHLMVFVGLFNKYCLIMSQIDGAFMLAFLPTNINDINDQQSEWKLTPY